MFKAPTVDVVHGCGAAGQGQDPTVADEDIVNHVSTQRDVNMEKKQHANGQHRDQPGQRAADVQASGRHDGGVPERLTHSHVPADAEKTLQCISFQYNCLNLNIKEPLQRSQLHENIYMLQLFYIIAHKCSNQSHSLSTRITLFFGMQLNHQLIASPCCCVAIATCRRPSQPESSVWMRRMCVCRAPE